MSGRRLALLLGLAVAVLAIAALIGQRRGPAHDPEFGTKVLPGLARQLDAVSGLRLIGAGNKPLVELARRDGEWHSLDPAYPADAARVRRLLVALGELRLLEPKTRDPSRLALLGLEDPADPTAQSVRLELLGVAAPNTLIVGRQAGTQGVYVRLAGSPQAIEARPGLDLPRAPRDWLQRGVVDIAAARVAAVEVARGDGPAWRAVRDSRSAEHFAVPQLPKGRELTNAGAADSSGSAFGNLEFDAVRPAVTPSAATLRHRAVVRTFDGLVVTLDGTSGNDHWLSVAAEFDSSLAARYATGAPKDAPAAEQVRSEAAGIQARTRGFEYQLPAYRFEAIFRRRDELLRH